MNINISERIDISNQLLSKFPILSKKIPIIFLDDDIMIPALLNNSYGMKIYQAISGINGRYPNIYENTASGLGKSPIPSDVIIIFSEFKASAEQLQLVDYYSKCNNLLSVISVYSPNKFDLYFDGIINRTLFCDSEGKE